MFVQCIVGSEVIRLAEGMGVKGAMLRDIWLYLISITGVLVFLASGKVRLLECEGERDCMTFESGFGWIQNTCATCLCLIPYCAPRSPLPL